MTVMMARQIVEQYATLFDQANCAQIKKAKSLLEQLKTWSKNLCMKTKKAKSFHVQHTQQQIRFYEQSFSEDHERIIALNVFFALCKVGAVTFNQN
mmetsp:Transcript_5406/g.6686  ORF Transcript_5406/g.6686 Transcript_5406/m.6686 type:complete len:96 (+) Transcript_5406:1021-1308(+)